MNLRQNTDPEGYLRKGSAVMCEIVHENNAHCSEGVLAEIIDIKRTNQSIMFLVRMIGSDIVGTATLVTDDHKEYMDVCCIAMESYDPAVITSLPETVKLLGF